MLAQVRFSALERRLSSENLAFVSPLKNSELASKDAYTPNINLILTYLISADDVTVAGAYIQIRTIYADSDLFAISRFSRRVRIVTDHILPA